MPDIKTIADKADIIVNGYAFTCVGNCIHVLNLNCPDKAVVFSSDGEVLETTMDDIENSSRIIIRRCISVGHSIATKAFITSKAVEQKKLRTLPSA